MVSTAGRSCRRPRAPRTSSKAKARDHTLDCKRFLLTQAHPLTRSPSVDTALEGVEGVEASVSDDPMHFKRSKVGVGAVVGPVVMAGEC